MLNDTRHWILGDSRSRRVADYRLAASKCGIQSVGCIGWIDLIESEGDALDRLPESCQIRVDSFGQRDEVLAALIRYGGGTAFPATGEIRSLNHQHSGLCRVMDRVSEWSIRRQDVQFDQKPSEIAVMFDKWATHQRLVAHRPKTCLLSLNVERALATLHEMSLNCGGRVFVKPRYASSASGVCCLRIDGSRQQLIAPLEIVRDGKTTRLFNSLRVRSFTNPGDIRDVLGVLIPQGTLVEAAVNKARIDGDRFDLRIVVINGKADHVVVRQSPSPITNLHLGNRRGSLESVTRAFGEARLDACRALAEYAARQFPDSLYCGVDILLPKSGNPLVCEVNAFGDFLPNLLSNGRTVYEAIVQASMRRQEAAV